ncbi:hypothetical protein HYW46_01020 [Candidatus Daviesbacteria bacterium]|nr:hypothetical protein [Candidatus Daviesbacteria bacterium]
MIKSGNFIFSTKLQLLLIAFLTTLAYSSFFQNGFIGDDEKFMMIWAEIRHIENIPRFFLGFGYGGDEANNTRYLPVGNTYLAIMYQLWGTNPLGYHFANLLVHIMSAVAVYFIAREIVMSVWFKTKNNLGINLVPFLTSLLFAIHPVQTETVNFVFLSRIILGFMFYFFSFLFFLKINTKFNLNLYLLSLFLALTAHLSYELTLSLPLMVFAYQLLMKFKTGKWRWKLSIPYFFIVLTYLFVKFGLVHMYGAQKYLADNFLLTWLVMLKVFVLYIKLLVFPLNLSIDPSLGPGIQVLLDPFSNINYLKSLTIFTPEIFLSLVVLVIIIFLGFKNFKKNPWVIFGIGWFFIALSPVSYIFPQDAAYQERYLYIASFGYTFILSCLIFKIFSLKKKFLWIKYLTIFCLIFYLSFYLTRTFLRNMDWKDSVTMWRKVVTQIPDSVVQNYVYAIHLESAGDKSLALEQYIKVINLEPQFIDIYTKIAEIYNEQGNIKRAVTFLNTALFLDPGHKSSKELLNSIIDKNSSTEGIIMTEGWVGRKIDGFLVFYPADWKINLGKQFEFRNRAGDFFLRLKFNELENLTADAFVKKQKVSAKVEKEGPAKLPNFNPAYVRILQDNQMQLFLFRRTKVVEVLLLPKDSPEMKVFEEMIGLLTPLE